MVRSDERYVFRNMTSSVRYANNSCGAVTSFRSNRVQEYRDRRRITPNRIIRATKYLIRFAGYYSKGRSSEIRVSRKSYRSVCFPRVDRLNKLLDPPTDYVSPGNYTDGSFSLTTRI